MMSSPQVTDKEIMREFVTVAASEAASAVKGKPPSAVLEGGKGKTHHNGAAAGVERVGKAGDETAAVGGDVDDARPTGYR